MPNTNDTQQQNESSQSSELQSSNTEQQAQPGGLQDALSANVLADPNASPPPNPNGNDDGMMTWSKKRKKFVSASQAPNDDVEDDRFFKDFEASEDGKAALKGGNLSKEEALALPDEAIAQIDPRSDLPKMILKKATKANWNNAKHDFADAKPNLMRKLWEYRQWHHKKVLQSTKKKVNSDKKDPKGLEEWAAAGSTGLTSDIDVNLKGTQTEYAVKIFNELFRREYSKEAGVVYDVNVYALDFMHEFKGVKSDDHLIVGQEGKRKGMEQGGIKDANKAKDDLKNQEEWATLKIRLYMNAQEWQTHKQEIDPNGAQADHWARVENKYKAYRNNLRGAMWGRVGKAIRKSEDVEKSGYQQIQKQADTFTKGTAHDPENISIGASNDVYEKRLIDVSKARNRLEVLVKTYNKLVNNDGQALHEENNDQVQTLSDRIDNSLLQLRELVSEAALFSNEAYLTDGAVNHTVPGLQGGNKIEVSKAGTLHAVQENMADTLKEISRHGGTIGEAAFKSGKYFWRMADAALNLQIDLGDLRDQVNALNTIGYKIANTIKSGPGNHHQLSADAIQSLATSPDALKALVTRVGQGIMKLYDQQVRGQSDLQLSSPVGQNVPQE